MRLEFENRLRIINTLLKLINLSIIDSAHVKRTMWERLKVMGLGLCLVHMILFSLAILGEFVWLVEAIVTGKTLWEITYNLPCLTLCTLGFIKVYCFIYYMQHVNELVDLLRNLQGNQEVYEKETDWESKRVSFLSVTTTTLLMLDILGVIAFALGPIAISISQYYTTGEVKLYLPFFLWYPFDQFDIRFWPIAYIHQLWASWVAVCSVYGPDYFFFTCCTFIQIIFHNLQHDFERIMETDSQLRCNRISVAAFKAEFVQLVDQHRKLIRCVKLLEIVYSKSALFNVVTSSLIICATGFNLMAIDNLALMAPFTAFLSMGMLQIFYYCYYGDTVMRSSLGVGNAVYNCHWYEAGAAARKYLLIVLVRSQKPCKLTAYGFTDINLGAFTRILSTSWSYFALLKQMYHN